MSGEKVEELKGRRRKEGKGKRRGWEKEKTEEDAQEQQGVRGYSHVLPPMAPPTVDHELVHSEPSLFTLAGQSPTSGRGGGLWGSSNYSPIAWAITCHTLDLGKLQWHPVSQTGSRRLAGTEAATGRTQPQRPLPRLAPWFTVDWRSPLRCPEDNYSFCLMGSHPQGHQDW